MDDQCQPIPVPSMTVQSLGSGSSGNAYFLRTATTGILVDCGVGIRQITAALQRLGLGIAAIDAVVVTHEHSDHVRSLQSVRRRRIPLLMTAGTAAALRLTSEEYTVLSPDATLAVDDLRIIMIATSHDAAEPCGVMVAASGNVVSILTDMGCPTERVLAASVASDLLVIEANHDVDMLRLGPYPPHLKRRVGSDLGHLSNRQTGELLAEALVETDRGPGSIWLAHLSATNNRPAIAEETIRGMTGSKLRGRTLDVLPRLAVGPVWTPGPPRPTQLDLFDART